MEYELHWRPFTSCSSTAIAPCSRPPSEWQSGNLRVNASAVARRRSGNHISAPPYRVPCPPAFRLGAGRRGNALRRPAQRATAETLSFHLRTVADAAAGGDHLARDRSPPREGSDHQQDHPSAENHESHHPARPGRADGDPAYVAA